MDVTLPHATGLDVLRPIREPGITVIIPASRAVMRRSDEPPRTADAEGPHRLRLGELDIDLTAHQVRVRGNTVSLTPSEFRILTILGEHPGQVFTRAQLLDKLNDEGTVYERTLDRHINNLRKKIEVNPQEPKYVLTVYGVGYKMSKP